MKKQAADEAIREYLRAQGSKGGKKRAETHTAEELSAWAKKGGRPKGSGKKGDSSKAKGERQ